MQIRMLKIKKIIALTALMAAALPVAAKSPPPAAPVVASQLRQQWAALRFEYFDTGAVLELCRMFFSKSFTDQWVFDRFGPLDIDFNIVHYVKNRDPALTEIELEYWRYQPMDARRFMGMTLSFRDAVPVNLNQLRQIFGKVLEIPRLSPDGPFIYQFAMKDSQYRDSRVILYTKKPIEYADNFLTQINFRHE